MNTFLAIIWSAYTIWLCATGASYEAIQTAIICTTIFVATMRMERRR